MNLLVYNWLLKRRISDYSIPEHIVLIVDESDMLQKNGFSKLEYFLEWCDELGIDRVSIHIHLLESSDELMSSLKNGVREVKQDVEIVTQSHDEKPSSNYTASIGVNGQAEFIQAIKNIAGKVQEGEIDPSDVTEDELEKELIFHDEPDMIIKTGGEHLTDFMIWQSVYSEIYFADFNWHNLRKRDLLRSIRDYQDRERRFGR